jgi:hypothetical protein
LCSPWGSAPPVRAERTQALTLLSMCSPARRASTAKPRAAQSCRAHVAVGPRDPGRGPDGAGLRDGFRARGRGGHPVSADATIMRSAKEYPNAHDSSGMISKFMPYRLATSVGGGARRRRPRRA